MTSFKTIRLVLVMLASVFFAQTATAQLNPFGEGWTLDSKNSSFLFQSVKNESVVEQSTFATFTGDIDPNGRAELRFSLDSIDTNVDLRNVRMRFLFFETFQFPEAKVSMQLDPALVASLQVSRREIVTLPYTLELRGQKKTMEATLAVTLIGDQQVLVSTHKPIQLSLEDFDLLGGLAKLEEAASVSIVPSSTVSFDLMFRSNGTAQPVLVAAAAPEQPASVALEPQGNFDAQACVGRFEILSRSDSIQFASGSAYLNPQSWPFLNSMVDIINRCPGMTIQVSGHTDSYGSNEQNQRLSELRAGSVAKYLADNGIPFARLRQVGYGEISPIADNSTAEGRYRNRRIEFNVLP